MGPRVEGARRDLRLLVAPCPASELILVMGNVLSQYHRSSDERIHICDRCGYWTRHKSALRVHTLHACRRSDGRFKTGRSAVTLDEPEHHHAHAHGPDTGCSACDGESDQYDDDILRDAVQEQLEQYVAATGDDLSPDAVAGLSDLLVGIMGNGKDYVVGYLYNMF